MSTSKLDLHTAVKDSLIEWFSNEEFISKITKTITDKVEQTIQEFEREIRQQNDKINSLEQKLDNVQQNMKGNNIYIYGVEEQPNENTIRKIMDLLNKNHTIKLEHKHILAAYRVGKLKENKHRPVIVKMADREVKLHILKNLKGFKGSKFFITEDLTNRKRNLLIKAKQDLGEKNVWSFDGHVYTKVEGRNFKIQSTSDILQYKH